MYIKLWTSDSRHPLFLKAEPTKTGEEAVSAVATATPADAVPEDITAFYNKMDAEDVNELIVVSELDEQGALNYDEALALGLNEFMDELNDNTTSS